MRNLLSFLYRNYIARGIARSDRISEEEFVKFVGDHPERFDISWGNNHCLVTAKMEPGYESIIYMVISEGFRGQGLGGSIIDSWLKSRAGTKVLLECSVDNPNAKAFWIKHGFDVVTEYTAAKLTNDESDLPHRMTLMSNFGTHFVEEENQRLLKMLYKYTYPPWVSEKQ